MLIWVVIGLYTLCLVFVLFYSLIQLHLSLSYLKKDGKPAEAEGMEECQLPVVTIQLPLYNERYVAERLVDSVVQIDYPKEKLHIQVLDDSNDDTTEILQEKINGLREEGVDIDLVRRSDRVGFKAGALQYGMKDAKGELIAIFDADFVPTSDFLRKTVCRFIDPKVGVVQTKWAHINEEYSLLTKCQAFGLDAHFTVEQKGRNKAGLFMNFNGTAGLWRKECIEDAGGWEHDTLTEDLDLSYRAQLKGWKFVYMEEVESPAELPSAISALKSQQYRWNKGAAETARKHLGKILRSRIPLITKIHASFHLLNSTAFLTTLALGILSVPMLWIKNEYAHVGWYFDVASSFLVCVIFLALFYYASIKHKQLPTGKRLRYFIVMFPLFMAVSMGISLHNALAVIDGYMGRKTPFIRTPKLDITDINDKMKGKGYLVSSLSLLTLLEGLLAVYFLGGLSMAFMLGDFALFPFHLLLFVGYTLVFSYSIQQSRLAAA